MFSELPSDLDTFLIELILDLDCSGCLRVGRHDTEEDQTDQFPTSEKREKEEERTE